VNSPVEVRAEEDTPSTLANLPATPAISTNPEKSGGGIPATNGSISRPEGEQAVGDAARTSAVEAEEELSITRSTTRFQIVIDYKTDEGKAKLRALDDVCRMVATARNAVIRWCWRRDADWIDAELLNTAALPRIKPQWPPIPKAKDPGGDAYAIVGRIAPALDGGVQSAVARDALAAWTRHRYDVLIRQTEAPVHYAPTQPIPIRKQEVKLVPEGVELRLFKVRSGGERIILPITARDARQKRELEAIRSGEWRHGAANIIRDRLRPSRWYLTIAYTRKIEKPAHAAKTAAVTIGMRAFLVALVGEESWIYDGHDIEAFLRQIQNRRREYQRDSKASNRWGRGRGRTLKPIAVLERKADNWRDTKIKTIARRLATWLRDRGVTTVVREDFSSVRDAPWEKLAGEKYTWDRVQQWPYYRMGVALDNALAEYGITVEILPPAWMVGTCPKCGERGREHCEIDRRAWRLRTGCGWKRHLDITQCANLLRRASGDVRDDLSGALAIQKWGKSRGKARREGRTPRGMIVDRGSAREEGANGAEGSGNGESGGET
jgi:transposase